MHAHMTILQQTNENSVAQKKLCEVIMQGNMQKLGNIDFLANKQIQDKCNLV